MERKMNKGKNIIITLLVILLITSFIITYLALKGTITLKENEKNKTEKTDKTPNTSTPVKPDESKFIRTTSLNLEETTCKNREIKASIINKNITLSYKEKEITIETKNAKYLYKTTYQVCENVNLFYITEDGKLYVINGLNELIQSNDVNNNDTLKISDIDSLRFNYVNVEKLSSTTDNIKEFLGDYTTPDKEVDNYGYLHLEIKVLDEENKERNFKYHSDVFR